MAKSAAADFHTIGKRLRERRLELGMSTHQVAEQAKVARYTLIRIEAGQPCRRSTLERIRRALRIFTDQMMRPYPENDTFVVSRAADLQWTVSMSKAGYQKQIVDDDPIHVDDPEERKRLGELGFQPFFTSILECELPKGVLKQALMELHRPSWVDRHFGEEFVYCLRGPVIMNVDGVPTTLEAGDSICFDANRPHQYLPGYEVGGDAPPALILVVVGLRPDEKKRKSVTS